MLKWEKIIEFLGTWCNVNENIGLYCLLSGKWSKVKGIHPYVEMSCLILGSVTTNYYYSLGALTALDSDLHPKAQIKVATKKKSEIQESKTEHPISRPQNKKVAIAPSLFTLISTAVFFQHRFGANKLKQWFADRQRNKFALYLLTCNDNFHCHKLTAWAQNLSDRSKWVKNCRLVTLNSGVNRYETKILPNSKEKNNSISKLFFIPSDNFFICESSQRKKNGEFTKTNYANSTFHFLLRW